MSVSWSNEEITQFVKQSYEPFRGEERLEIEEIGDGNINYVYRVRSPKGQSVILKVATGTLRSSGRDLTTDRIHLEVAYLQRARAVDPDRIPEIFCFDAEKNAVLMEDIGTHQNLRYALEAERILPKLPEQIGRYCAEMAFRTSDLSLSPEKKKAEDRFFVNPAMCDISEDLVFTEPYGDYKGRNRIAGENDLFIRWLTEQDPALLAKIGQLRFRFMNWHEALLHGDLHSGSIFVTEDDTKVIDSEFAFYGPVGYDVGNVVAHFVIAYAAKAWHQHADATFMAWLRRAMEETIRVFEAHLFELMCQTPMLETQNGLFAAEFIQSIRRDTLAYAGTEIIRRTIGDTKTREIELAEQTENGAAFQRQLFLLGRELVLGSDRYDRAATIAELTERYFGRGEK